MKQLKFGIFLMAGIFLLTVQCVNKDKQQANDQNNEENWTVLFDGSNTDHWRDTKSDHFPEHGWLVDRDVLTVLGKTDSHEAGHDIVTRQLFSNFELELEVNLTTGANSGIKYFVTDSFPGNEGNYLGLEYQLIDNENHPDAHLGRDGNRKMGALYDLIPPAENVTIHTPGEWNKVRILVDGKHVEHWLNDTKLLEFDRHSLAFRELVSLSKYKKLQKFGEQEKGRILLQGHGNDVSFRNIRIRTW